MDTLLRNVTYRYPGRERPSLGPIDVRFIPGTVTILTGATGSGKSTLLKTLNGLIPRSAAGEMTGEVQLDGRAIASLSQADVCRRVGLVLQSPDDQMVSATVGDETRFGLENLGLDPATIDTMSNAALTRVGLHHLHDAAIATLSGGQRQRLAIASILAMRPALVAVDEPLSQLDPDGVSDALALLHELAHGEGLTIVLAEHRLEEALRIADRLIVLEDGGIVADGSPSEILRDTSMLRAGGIEVPPLCQLAESRGLDVRPLHEADAVAAFSQLPVPTPAAHIDRLPSRAVMLAARALEFQHGRDANLRITVPSLELCRGEVVALIGKNGSGKTTLLHLLLGLLQPSRGVIERPYLASLARWQRRGAMGYVPQNADLMLQALDVRHEVAFGALHTCQDRHEGEQRARLLLDRFELASLAHEPVFSLSAGQRQRVAVTAALATNPAVLLLDEPTTGQNRGHLERLMRDTAAIQRERGASLVFATHDLRTALAHADRIVALRDGHIAFDGPADRVAEAAHAAGLRLPTHLRVAAQLGWPLKGGPLTPVLEPLP